MNKYARRIDGNHADIRDGLRAIPGVKVLDTHHMAGLGADMIVFYQDRPPLFLEIKTGPKEPLTDSERRLKSMAGDYWARVETLEGALTVLGISTDAAPEEW